MQWRPQDKGDALCEGEGVKGFPTLILYKDGKKLGEEYEGSRKLEDIKTFLDGARAGKIEEKTETPEPTKDGEGIQFLYLHHSINQSIIYSFIH